MKMYFLFFLHFFVVYSPYLILPNISLYFSIYNKLRKLFAIFVYLIKNKQNNKNVCKKGIHVAGEEYKPLRHLLLFNSMNENTQTFFVTISRKIN